MDEETAVSLCVCVCVCVYAVVQLALVKELSMFDQMSQSVATSCITSSRFSDDGISSKNLISI